MEDMEDTQDLDGEPLPDIVSLDSDEISSNDESNEYVAEGRVKSNNDSFPPVHVYIT